MHLSPQSGDVYLKEIKQQNIPLMLGFTSNVITSGLRQHISTICKEFNVIGIVTTAGAIEQDFIKSYKPFKLLEVPFKDALLREKGLNRSANIIVENENYLFLEKSLNKIVGSVIDITPTQLIG